jgi:hypothetical protein
MPMRFATILLGVLALVAFSSAPQSAALGAAHPEVEAGNAPRPVVIAPDVTGEGDWHVATRGPAMDFENGADPFVMYDGRSSLRNAVGGIGGGWLNAFSAGQFDDPQLYLSDALWHGAVIDAEEWHRITFNIKYDGTPGVGAVPGQGLDLRFCWYPANQPPSCSTDMFPALGPTTYTVDLKTNPPSAIEAEGYTGLGFGGPGSRWVSLLRFDPHEDPGFRSWHVEGFRISHDARVPFGGTYQIRFRDDAYQPGSTAQVYIDDNTNLADGATLFSQQPLQPGENTASWDGRVGAGKYWVHVVVTNSSNVRSVATSTGPIDVPDPVRWSPFGTFEGVLGGRGRFVVSGFAVDPDWVSGPVGIHVYVDGRLALVSRADQAHHGIAMLRTDAGPWHGFSREVLAAPGPHDVCVFAVNNGYGNDTSLGCRGVVVK